MDFANACSHYELERNHLNSSVLDLSQRLMALRVMNDKLMNVERAFIHPEGLPGRPYYK